MTTPGAARQARSASRNRSAATSSRISLRPTTIASRRKATSASMPCPYLPSMTLGSTIHAVIYWTLFQDTLISIPICLDSTLAFITLKVKLRNLARLLLHRRRRRRRRHLLPATVPVHGNPGPHRRPFLNTIRRHQLPKAQLYGKTGAQQLRRRHLMIHRRALSGKSGTIRQFMFPKPGVRKHQLQGYGPKSHLVRCWRPDRVRASSPTSASSHAICVPDRESLQAKRTMDFASLARDFRKHWRVARLVSWTLKSCRQKTCHRFCRRSLNGSTIVQPQNLRPPLN